MKVLAGFLAGGVVATFLIGSAMGSFRPSLADSVSPIEIDTRTDGSSHDPTTSPTFDGRTARPTDDDDDDDDDDDSSPRPSMTAGAGQSPLASQSPKSNETPKPARTSRPSERPDDDDDDEDDSDDD